MYVPRSIQFRKFRFLLGVCSALRRHDMAAVYSVDAVYRPPIQDLLMSIAPMLFIGRRPVYAVYSVDAVYRPPIQDLLMSIAPMLFIGRRPVYAVYSVDAV